MIPGDYPNLIINCADCRTVVYELDPVVHYVKKTFSSDKSKEKVEAGYKHFIEDGGLEKFLAKEGWKQLLHGGYICPSCSEHLRCSVLDNDKMIGFLNREETS